MEDSGRIYAVEHDVNRRPYVLAELVDGFAFELLVGSGTTVTGKTRPEMEADRSLRVALRRWEARDDSRRRTEMASVTALLDQAYELEERVSQERDRLEARGKTPAEAYVEAEARIRGPAAAAEAQQNVADAIARYGRFGRAKPSLALVDPDGGDSR